MISQALIDMFTEAALTQQQTDSFEHEKQKIIQALDADVYSLLGKCNAVLAGGAITSIFTGREINDWDIYFKDKEGFSRFLLAVYGESESDDVPAFRCRVNHFTSRSILVSDSTGGQHIQLIGMKVFPTMKDIFNSFDFTACMGAFDFKSETFVLHKDFLKDNSQRRLVVNTKTEYPLVSVLRVDKYRQRGYDISKAQMMRLLLAVNKKEISSWKHIKEELGGLYGLNPDEVVDETKEFSLEEAMEQLGKLFVPKQYDMITNKADLDILLKSFDHMVEDKVKEWAAKGITWSTKLFDFEGKE